MPTSRYFNLYDYVPEQALVQTLVDETLSIVGHEVLYLPRTMQNPDRLFSEDPLSTFENAIPIEAWIRDYQGFQGGGDVISRLGLQIQDEITLTISRNRWEEARTPKLLAELGPTILLESTDRNRYLTRSARRDPKDDADGAIELEDQTYDVTATRPLEGDLIYIPMIAKVFEVKFVEHEDVFYQTGNLQTYDLRCELWVYSSERVTTENREVDDLLAALTMDELTNDELSEGDVVTEDDMELTTEDGDRVALEESDPANVDAESDNVLPDSAYEDVVDRSERSPFS